MKWCKNIVLVSKNENEMISELMKIAKPCNFGYRM